MFLSPTASQNKRKNNEVCVNMLNEEIYYAVTISGLPKMFLKASSPAEVKTKLRLMLKKPSEDIVDIERATPADVRKHFRDMLKPDREETVETYSPQKHEWGTETATEYYKSLTPGQKNKKESEKMIEHKSFFQFREGVQSADKKPQNYKDPVTGKIKTRMVPSDKEIVVREDIEEMDEMLMAKRQLEFIEYACEEIDEYLDLSGDAEPWFYSKLSGIFEKVKDMHAYVEGDKRVRELEGEDEEDMEESVKAPTGDLKNACWKGYTAVGTKKKNGKTVPNCVPKESVDKKHITLESLRKQTAKNSSRFPEGSTVSRKKDGKKGRVMTVGKDFVKVASGNKMVDHKPQEIE